MVPLELLRPFLLSWNEATKFNPILLTDNDDKNPEYFPTYGSTFDKIIENGVLNCGTKLDFAGFSERGFDEETGLEWHGFDVDICRAVSAAIFGDKTCD